MATTSLFPSTSASYCRAPLVTERERFNQGAWRHSPARRRTVEMWQVRDYRNDVVADVYTGEADARLIAAAARLRQALTALVQAGQSDYAHEQALSRAQALLREIAA